MRIVIPIPLHNQDLTVLITKLFILHSLQTIYDHCYNPFYSKLFILVSCSITVIYYFSFFVSFVMNFIRNVRQFFLGFFFNPGFANEWRINIRQRYYVGAKQ